MEEVDNIVHELADMSNYMPKIMVEMDTTTLCVILFCVGMCSDMPAPPDDARFAFDCISDVFEEYRGIAMQCITMARMNAERRARRN